MNRHRGHLERAASPRGLGAFTLIEVLVVVAIIALLISILLPSLAAARSASKSTVCLSQLRQMAVAAQAYSTAASGSYPPYTDTVYTPEFEFLYYQRKIEYCWDFTRVSEAYPAKARIKSGLLWQGKTLAQVQQCPVFAGSANWDGDPYTGYNYNTSYVGTFLREANEITTPSGTTTLAWSISVRPARQDQIRRAGRCAIFGDGEYSRGANKFMRSPWGEERGARDGWASSERSAGTQGFRHLKKTNASFADGHAESLIKRYAETYEYLKKKIPENVGFLSPDNSMYSLDGRSGIQTASK
jgi:prepilin-type N-terminal cleavage/methylation domain-containing protein/prepilin-type processing-associated H-X9-DG protein